MRSMIESATQNSLILLDEIGSSTEPGEGAALARAVLEEFRRIGALAIATTHYNRLKFYAETTTGVANAAGSVMTIRIGSVTIMGVSNAVAPPSEEPGVYTIDFTLPATLNGAGDQPIVVTVTVSGTSFSSRLDDTAPRVRIL
jgi:hypothetical protein